MTELILRESSGHKNEQSRNKKQGLLRIVVHGALRGTASLFKVMLSRLERLHQRTAVTERILQRNTKKSGEPAWQEWGLN